MSSFARSALVMLALVSVGVCCSASLSAGAPGSALAQDAAARAGSGRSVLAALPVPSFRDAVVVAPRAAGARPILVVLHGMGDRPDSICGAFDALVAGRAWILCPRGVPFGDRSAAWTFPLGRRSVGPEVHAALAALSQAHGAAVDARAPVLAGFSLGAMHASFLAGAEPGSFPRAFILDTHYVWSRPQIARFAAAGGRGVSFVCSRTYVRDCVRLAPEGGAVAAVAAPTHIVLLRDREHGYDRALFDLLRQAFEALVSTDARWVAPAAPPR